MDITVQKFGGSSLATDRQVGGVAERIAIDRQAGRRLVVVVSARGDTTDRLLAAAGALRDGAPGPAPARETDQLLATGEIESAALLALALEARGVPAESMTGIQAGLRARGPHGAGVVSSVDTERLHAALDAGRVPVVAGFQATTDDGDVITLGRGGSDTSAVALAAGIGASRCEVYTDVDGVFEADPRIVGDAGALESVSMQVMAEMAFAGARVLHVRAVELAAATGVDLVVRHAHLGGRGSTVRSADGALEAATGVTSVCHENDLAQIVVHRAPGTAELLTVLSRHRLSLDALTTWTRPDGLHMVLCVPAPDVDEVESALAPLLARHGGELETRRGIGKVSLVGTGLLSRPAVAAGALMELLAADVAAECVSSTQSRICFVVPAEQVADGVAALHRCLRATPGSPDTPTPQEDAPCPSTSPTEPVSGSAAWAATPIPAS